MGQGRPVFQDEEQIEMANKKGKGLKLSKDVIFRQLDFDDGILLNIDTKNYYSLNETACEILKGIKKGESISAIEKRLVKR